MRGRDHGAAAVEFALVVPILIFLLLGIVDYGLYFTNALAVRAGVSEAARQISVGNFAESCEDFGAGSHTQLVAKVQSCISPVGAEIDDISVDYPNPWTVGENVTVCAIVEVTGLTGFTPRPNGGLVAAQVSLPIQQANWSQLIQIQSHAIEGSPETAMQALSRWLLQSSRSSRSALPP